MRRTVQFVMKHPRPAGANVSRAMPSIIARIQLKSFRTMMPQAILCAIGIGASALAGATSETAVSPQESLDEAWWTGPLLAPNAATLPHGHWLLEPYVYDLMPYGRFDRNGKLTSTGAGHDIGSQAYIEYGLVDRFTLGLIPRLGLYESSAG